jgi:heme exporter protein D
MNWNSPAAFFAMGGYAAYVWGSFAVCVVAVAGELVALRARRAAIARVIGRRVTPRPAARPTAMERTA